MQDLQDKLTDMGQFPGDKAGQYRAKWFQLKLIRTPWHSERYRRYARFAAHP
jgi:hypothetical protein